MNTLSLAAKVEQICLEGARNVRFGANVEQLNVIYQALWRAMISLEHQRVQSCRKGELPQIDVAIQGLKEIAATVDASKQALLREELRRGPTLLSR